MYDMSYFDIGAIKYIRFNRFSSLVECGFDCSRGTRSVGALQCHRQWSDATQRSFVWQRPSSDSRLDFGCGTGCDTDACSQSSASWADTTAYGDAKAGPKCDSGANANANANACAPVIYVASKFDIQSKMCGMPLGIGCISWLCI
jgi:hypothetical protein